MTAPAGVSVAPLFVLEHELGGAPATPARTRVTVAYGCSCGRFVSDRRGTDDPAPLAQTREHLVDEHPGTIAAGRCAQCGALTWAFRAHVPDLGTDHWLCELHAPPAPALEGGDGPAS